MEDIKIFFCLGYGSRVAIFCGGKYSLCRNCQNFSYSSQQQTPPFRLLRKAQKIRRLLDASPDTDEPIVEKPKGMHQKTFNRLKQEAYQASEQSWEAMAREVGMDIMKQFGLDLYLSN